MSENIRSPGEVAGKKLKVHFLGRHKFLCINSIRLYLFAHFAAVSAVPVKPLDALSNILDGVQYMPQADKSFNIG